MQTEQHEIRKIYPTPEDYRSGSNEIHVTESEYDRILAGVRRSFPYAVGVASTTDAGREAAIAALTR